MGDLLNAVLYLLSDTHYTDHMVTTELKEDWGRDELLHERWAQIQVWLPCELKQSGSMDLFSLYVLFSQLRPRDVL